MKLMNDFLKRTVMCSVMFVVVGVVYAQEQNVQHKVQRGETLESIAKQYGVTEQMIKEANPQMGVLFYAGLKLNIPSAKKNVSDQPVENEKIVEKTVIKEESNRMIESVEVQNTGVGLKSKEVKGSADTEGNLYYIAVKDGWGVGLSYNGDSNCPLGIGFGYLFYDTMGMYSSNGGVFFHVDYTQAFWLDAKETIYIRPILGVGYAEVSGKGKHGYEFLDYKVKGLMANLHAQMGVKLWSTSKGNAVCLSVGYLHQALKFKFEGEGCFTAGLSFVL